MSTSRFGSIEAKDRDSPGVGDVDNSTKSEILKTTLELLEHHGYSGVTTDLIASMARVSKSTIYRHWGSKEELIVEAVRLRFPRVKAPDLGGFEPEIAFVLEARMENYRQSGMPRLVAGLVGAASGDKVLRDAFENWIAQLSGTIHDVIERGLWRGEIDEGVDAQALEALIAGVVARVVVTQRAFPKETVMQVARLLTRAASSRA